MNKIQVLIAGTLLFHSSPYSFGKTDSTAHLSCVATPIENKKLTHKNIMLLNTSLQQNPTATLRIKMSAQVVGKALASLTQARTRSLSDQKQFVTTQLHAILKPVEQFFDVIQEYSSMVLPLLEESLTNHKHLSNAVLVQYFHSKQGIKSFCEKEITSIEKLEQLCNELSSFFGDLEASFTPPVEEAFKALMQSMKNKKR